ncbi:MAG: helicase C-terminal domain-containing protein, partial [Chitinispirillia bacterium]
GECSQIQLSSPFPETNFGLYIYRSISTKYIYRSKSYEKIADIIFNVYQVNPGNYLVYFPSYAYLDNVIEYVNRKYKMSNIEIQNRAMNENERADFLTLFSENRGNNVCAFAVMGGIFGEGIDLKGDRLIGVIIVGVGLPQICLERNLIMDFFSKNSENGFAYSYQLPGFNRVMQAAGRVIRSETDRGVAVLIDTRFSVYRYTSIFPNEWRNYKMVQTSDELSKELKDFWNNC